jgi:flagellar assembly protein FliH
LSNDNRSRIPAGEGQGYSSWLLPSVEDGDIVEAVKTKKPPTATIEDVELDDVPGGAISAEELERISNEAHEEGYTAGFEAGRQAGLKAGHDEGHTQGHSAGYEAGLDQAKIELNQQMLLLQQILQRLIEPMSEREEQVEIALLELLKQALTAVLCSPLVPHQETLKAVVQQTVMALPVTAKDVLIYLNPEDVGLMSSIMPLKREWQIEEDLSMMRGGCRVETRQSQIDNSLESRLDQVFDQIALRGELAAVPLNSLANEPSDEQPGQERGKESGQAPGPKADQSS